MIGAFCTLPQPAAGQAERPAEQVGLIADGGFESGKLRDTIHWRSSPTVELTQDEAFSGAWCLSLNRGEKAVCTTLRFPIEAGQKYSLTFMARVDGPGLMTTDDPHALERVTHTKGLASWRLSFNRSDTPDESLSRGFPQFVTKVVHGEWTEYREDFYPPAGADEVRIIFGNGAAENELRIDAIKLVPLGDGPVNLNPDIALGPLNFTGYGYAHHARITPKDDGSGDGYLDTTEGWVIGDPIPVEQRKYQLSFRGRIAAPGDRLGTRLQYCDADMEEVGELSIWSLAIRDTEWTDRSYEFIPPPGTAFIRIIFGGGYHDWFRIEEVANAPSSSDHKENGHE